MNEEGCIVWCIKKTDQLLYSTGSDVTEGAPVTSRFNVV